MGVRQDQATRENSCQTDYGGKLLTPLRGGVYAIKCSANGRVYIGATGNLAERKSQHKSRLKANRHDHPELQADYNAHGKSVFAWHVLLYSDSDLQRVRLESSLVLLLKSEGGVYNKTVGSHHLTLEQLGDGLCNTTE
ncbi:GIY-YIG nuclease family protein [Zavarzinella formosa]|uniref:GIY-YIG nuclease family protein n=1 Tax=Zavarzinella formosa TaxID=360055 RepID=UPI0036F3E5D5